MNNQNVTPLTTTRAAEPRKTNGDINRLFLDTITPQAKEQILESIAKHYGVSTLDIYDELVDSEAHHLLEYMTEPQRSAAHVLMQKYHLSRAA